MIRMSFFKSSYLNFIEVWAMPLLLISIINKFFRFMLESINFFARRLWHFKMRIFPNRVIMHWSLRNSTFCLR